MCHRTKAAQGAQGQQRVNHHNKPNLGACAEASLVSPLAHVSPVALHAYHMTSTKFYLNLRFLCIGDIKSNTFCFESEWLNTILQGR